MGKRSRSWACVFYPDSMPDNYLSIVQSWHIPALISPLHDEDFNADDTEKKAHYHLLLVFDGMKSYDQIYSLTSQLNGTIPIPVENTNGMIRYFIHLDNPEKHQYFQKDLVCLSGFDCSNAFDSQASRYRMLDLVESVINDNDIDNFYLLIKWLRVNDMPDIVQFLQSSPISYIRFYLQEKARHKKGNFNL